MANQKFKCYKCNKEFETDEIRYSASDKLICVYCLGTKKPEIISIDREIKKGSGEKEQFTEYQCGKCSYTFKRNKSFIVESCPYCGKPGTLTKKSKLKADNILKDSLDRRYDY